MPQSSATRPTADRLPTAARLSVAPMMDWTDRHCRFFHRQLCRQALLYTEMVTAAALVHGDAQRLLAHSPAEQPLALQLGGSDPKELAEAAAIGAAAGFREINLNVGCPSDRVQSGCFGAVLMRSPDLVAACVAAMARAAPTAEITVKCRLGVDDQDPDDALPALAAAVREAGVRRVIVHARKAWLAGLSPKANREVPPLEPDRVVALKRDFPDLHLSVNGGIGTLAAARRWLDAGLDGVMVGRAAYQRPADILCGADAAIWGAPSGLSPEAALLAICEYAEDHVAAGGRLHDVTRHMLGLFAGRAGARAWRRHLSEAAGRPGAGSDVLLEAFRHVAPSDAAPMAAE